MEAHHVLAKRGFDVFSYGTNAQVKLPGPSADRPNSYAFGTPYEHIQQDLRSKDPQLYTQNGLLMLLDRNKAIKPAPERFQDRPRDADPFDMIITCEERCFDLVAEDLLSRGIHLNRPVWLVNFDIRDTPEDAAVGARSILQMAQAVREVEGRPDAEEQVARIVEDFQQKSTTIPILYTVHFY